MKAVNLKKGEAIPTLLLVIGLLIAFLFLGLYLARFVPWSNQPDSVDFFDIFGRSESSSDGNSENSNFFGSDGASEDETDLGGSEVVTGNASFLTIEQGVFSGVRQSGALIINNQSDWIDVWNQIYSNNPPPVPSVDFNKVFLIAVFQGNKNSGGHSISIDGIALTNNFWRVHVTEVEPGNNCVVSQVETQPYHVIGVEHLGQDIKFVSDVVVNNCD